MLKWIFDFGSTWQDHAMPSGHNWKNPNYCCMWHRKSRYYLALWSFEFWVKYKLAVWWSSRQNIEISHSKNSDLGIFQVVSPSGGQEEGNLVNRLPVWWQLKRVQVWCVDLQASGLAEVIHRDSAHFLVWAFTRRDLKGENHETKCSTSYVHLPVLKA